MKAPLPLDLPPSPNRKQFPFKGSLVFQGLRISVENPAGTYREGLGWRVKMPWHYGELRRIRGVDGDKLDVFVGPSAIADHVYVIRQRVPGQDRYDEDKCMLGFDSQAEAEQAYRAAYTDGRQFYGDTAVLTMPEFKEWIVNPANNGQPVGREGEMVPLPGGPLLNGFPTGLQKAEGASMAAGPGPGWFPAPGSRNGAYRKKAANGGWIYAYPPFWHVQSHPHPDDAATVAGPEQPAEQASKPEEEQWDTSSEDMWEWDRSDDDLFAPVVTLNHVLIGQDPKKTQAIGQAAQQGRADLASGAISSEMSFEQWLDLPVFDLGPEPPAENEQERLLPPPVCVKDELADVVATSEGIAPTAILAPVPVLTLPSGEKVTAPTLLTERTPEPDDLRRICPTPDLAPSHQEADPPDEQQIAAATETAAVAPQPSEPLVEIDDPEELAAEVESLPDGSGPDRPDAEHPEPGFEFRRMQGVDYTAMQTKEQIAAHLASVSPFGGRPGWGRMSRLKKNADALDLSYRLEEEGRAPTAEEATLLASYSGRGGIGQSINEFYTPVQVVSAIWAGIAEFLPEDAKVLEPSCGPGCFLQHAPNGVRVTGVELEAPSASIAAALHPQHEVINAPFEKVAVQDLRRWDAVVGNPPFGMRGASTKVDPAKSNMHGEQYGLDTALDKVHDGGIVAMVLPATVLDGQSPAARAFRARIANKAELVTVHRLPSGTFRGSGSDSVVTDIVVMRKRPQEVANLLSELRGDEIGYTTGNRRVFQRSDADQRFIQGGQQLFEEQEDRRRGSYDPETQKYVYPIVKGSNFGTIHGEVGDLWNGQREVKGKLTPEILAGVTQDIRDRLELVMASPQPNAKAILDKAEKLAAARREYLERSLLRLPYHEPEGTKRLFDGVQHVLRKGEDGVPRWLNMDEVPDMAGKNEASRRAVAEARELGQGILDLQAKIRAGASSPAELALVRDQLRAKFEAWKEANGQPATIKRLPGQMGDQKVARAFVAAVGVNGQLCDLLTRPLHSWKPATDEKPTDLASAVQISERMGAGTVSPAGVAEMLGHQDVNSVHSWLLQSPDHFLEEDGRWTNRPEYLSGLLRNKRDVVERQLALVNGAMEHAGDVKEWLTQAMEHTEGGDTPEGRLFAEKLQTADNLPHLKAKLEAQQELLNQHIVSSPIEDVDFNLRSGWMPLEVVNEFIRTHVDPAMQLQNDGISYQVLMNGVPLTQDDLASASNPETPMFKAKVLAKYFNRKGLGRAQEERAPSAKQIAKWIDDNGWGARHTNEALTAMLEEAEQAKTIPPETLKDLRGKLENRRASAGSQYRGSTTAEKKATESDVLEELSDKFKALVLQGRLHDHAQAAYDRKVNNYVKKTYSTDPIEKQDWDHGQYETTAAGRNVRVGGGRTPHGYQNQVIRQGMEAERLVIAHNVGLGKTTTVIAMIAANQAAGKHKRPMITVPKAVLWNWEKEILENRPNARVLVIGENRKPDGTTESDSGKDRIDKLHQYMQGNYDYTIITKEAYESIPVDPKVKIAMIDRMFARKMREAGLEAGPGAPPAAGEEDGKRAKSESKKAEARAKLLKQKEEMIKSYEEKEAARIAAGQPRYDELGVDGLYFDEAHSYKNLFMPAQQEGKAVKFLAAGSISARALDAQVKCQIQRDANGGRGVYMATATPVKNTPLEVYTMISYVAPDVLEEMGIHDHEQFLEQFADIRPVETVNAMGEFEMVPGLVGFKNVKAMRRLMERVIVKRDAKDVGLPIPATENLAHVTKPTEDQQKVHALLQQRMNRILTMTGEERAALAQEREAKREARAKKKQSKEELKALKAAEKAKTPEQRASEKEARQMARLMAMGSEEEVDAAVAAAAGGGGEEEDDEYRQRLEREASAEDPESEETVLSLLGEMVKNSTDPSLVHEHYRHAAGMTDTSSPKLLDAADRIAKAYHADSEGGHVVFCDYNAVHGKLRDMLVDRGVPKEAIGLVNATEAPTSGHQLAISKDYNDLKGGKLRIVIGNTAKMGEGVNLQGRTTDLHHIDVPWDPGTQEQRNGRAIRQGNPHAKVRNNHCLTEGTADGMKYGVQSGKEDWKQKLWHGDEDTVAIPTDRMGLGSRDELLLLASSDREATQRQLDAQREAGRKEYAEKQKGVEFAKFFDWTTRMRRLDRMKQEHGEDPKWAPEIKAGQEGADRVRAALEASPYFHAKPALDHWQDGHFDVNDRKDAAHYFYPGQVVKDSSGNPGHVVSASLKRDEDGNKWREMTVRSLDGARQHNLSDRHGNEFRTMTATYQDVGDADALMAEGLDNPTRFARAGWKAAANLPISTRDKHSAKVKLAVAKHAPTDRTEAEHEQQARASGHQPTQALMMRQTKDGPEFQATYWRSSGQHYQPGAGGWQPFIGSKTDVQALRQHLDGLRDRVKQGGELTPAEQRVVAAVDEQSGDIDTENPHLAQLVVDDFNRPQDEYVKWQVASGGTSAGEAADWYAGHHIDRWREGLASWPETRSRLTEEQAKGALRQTLAQDSSPGYAEALRGAQSDPQFAVLAETLKNNKEAEKTWNQYLSVPHEHRAPVTGMVDLPGGGKSRLKLVEAFGVTSGSAVNKDPETGYQRISGKWQMPDGSTVDGHSLLHDTDLTQASVDQSKANQEAHIDRVRRIEAQASSHKEQAVANWEQAHGPTPPALAAHRANFMAGRGSHPDQMYSPSYSTLTNHTTGAPYLQAQAGQIEHKLREAGWTYNRHRNAWLNPNKGQVGYARDKAQLDGWINEHNAAKQYLTELHAEHAKVKQQAYAQDMGKSLNYQPPGGQTLLYRILAMRARAFVRSQSNWHGNREPAILVPVSVAGG